MKRVKSWSSRDQSRGLWRIKWREPKAVEHWKSGKTLTIVFCEGPGGQRCPHQEGLVASPISHSPFYSNDRRESRTGSAPFQIFCFGCCLRGETLLTTSNMRLWWILLLSFWSVYGELPFIAENNAAMLVNWWVFYFLLLKLKIT